MFGYGTEFTTGTLLWFAGIILVTGIILYRTHRSVSKAPIVKESYYDRSDTAEYAMGFIVILTVIIISAVVIAGALLAWLSM